MIEIIATIIIVVAIIIGLFAWRNWNLIRLNLADGPPTEPNDDHIDPWHVIKDSEVPEDQDIAVALYDEIYDRAVMTLKALELAHKLHRAEGIARLQSRLRVEIWNLETVSDEIQKRHGKVGLRSYDRIAEVFDNV